jgi:hypothetical protein
VEALFGPCGPLVTSIAESFFPALDFKNTNEPTAFAPPSQEKKTNSVFKK